MNMTDAIKMMNEGFALMTKGLASMVESCKEDKVANTDTGIMDTKTCTLEDAAKLLGCSRSTISRLCDAGELKYTKDPRSGYRRVITTSIAGYHHRLCEEAQKVKEAA